jgi:hypothetical protein
MTKFNSILLALLLVASIATPIQAATPVNINPTTPATSAKMDALVIRLNEINTIDKSTLNSSEKKNLRKEVRSLKREVKNVNGGVYISVGALLIIILILIILL